MWYTRGKHIFANVVKLLQESRDLFFQKALDDLCSTTHRRTMDRRFRVAALSGTINQSVKKDQKGRVHIGTISVEVRRTSAQHVKVLRQLKGEKENSFWILDEIIRKENKDNMHTIEHDQCISMMDTVNRYYYSSHQPPRLVVVLAQTLSWHTD